MDNKIISELLNKFCITSSVSGTESKIRDVIKDLFKDEKCEIKTDVLGNLLVTFKGNGKSFLLDAHIDQIGMIVTSITEKGFLKVSSVGGVDTRVFNSSEVIVHGKEDVYGIITSIPPHLTKDGDENKASKISDVSIDIGLTKEDAEKVISLGDRISFKPSYNEMLNNCVCGTSIDDRSGAVAIIYAYYLLKEMNVNPDLTLMFSSQEETGGSGAKVGSFDIQVDEAIAVDVSFGTAPGVDKCKGKELHKGPMICISPSLNCEMSNRIISVAKDKNIPYQVEVCGSRTGTNADDIVVSGSGKVTGLISIPQRNMHTVNEVIALDDIENTAKLIADYIAERVAENV